MLTHRTFIKRTKKESSLPGALGVMRIGHYFSNPTRGIIERMTFMPIWMVGMILPMKPNIPVPLPSASSDLFRLADGAGLAGSPAEQKT